MGSDEDAVLAGPFWYGRWDETAREHHGGHARQLNRAARAAHYAEGAFDPDATRAAIAGLEIPVLILVGELDFSPSPVLATQLGELFAPGWVRLVVQPGAGHHPWLDDAARFGDVVTRWLAGS
ncbi:alpha/beta hydrolase [Kitasatospora sp. NPDC096077]|uniref:alpha/beta fold hydrolase n=1 Tax=Kitasatospora sp. NPDC096077 TaxID=3155544 RepID=UPI0033255C89